jgi:ribulose-5-phosphate 4-epimerase/fuculose-1-phosphate aldolase
MLRNHGLLVVGSSTPEAFVLMFNFEATCQIQISAQSGGALVHVNPAITAGVAAMLVADGGKVGGDFAWPAMLRKVERLDPSYKT